MQQPLPGQRWVSSSEPELGLGLVIAVEGDRVEICFPAAEEMRMYAFSSAPLLRARFKPGDRIQDQEGTAFTVDKTEERDGLVVYHGGDRELPEEQLLDSLSFIKPEDRLLAGHTDHHRSYKLRLRALDHNTRIRKSPARGYTGARIDLIPHQMAIAAEAAGRLAPRILLADEVGLGKTIEACLIMHRLHLTGRADRVLILVPEPLIHQWFVELLRRFNLLFALFDEDRCASIESNDPAANPFLDSQLVLCATGFLANSPKRGEQAKAAGFDLLIVDEAHHLEWHPDDPSPAYTLVDDLAKCVPSLLLLTATPEQLGPDGHFARLRLLDPDRYSDLQSFQAEAAGYEPLADAVARLKAGKMPTKKEKKLFAGRSPRADHATEALLAGDESARQELITDLIDSFGTGRVMFRNTREHLTGFPERKLHLAPLSPDEDADALTGRVAWLTGLLHELEDRKIVVICHSLERAESIKTLLLELIQVEAALFHEELSLLQRDRNAAWFAEPDGARILICSEIGSEGRNFQFAHHLVLFDLPEDPELLEQRIGRLDRIGQTETINIHVPYEEGTPSEILTRWYAEGLNAFEHPLKGAATLTAALLPELIALQADPNPDPKDVAAFLERTRTLHDDVAAELAGGHDRLLELGAPSAEKAADLINHIEDHDNDDAFERFAIRLFDNLGVTIEDLGPRSYILKPGQRLAVAFADLPEEGTSVTFDRRTALGREDLVFLTADHPMVRDALGMLLTSEKGNATFGIWKTARERTLLLECHFVLECLAPNRLHADQFLPPTGFRVLVDHQGNDLTEDTEFPRIKFDPGDPRKLVAQEAFRLKIFPGMLAHAESLVQDRADKQRSAAMDLAQHTLTAEIERLEDLAQRNDHIPDDEIQSLKDLRNDLAHVLSQSRLRLDSLRLVWKSPT
jgi:ATP-dependent helicase HepA